MYRAAEAVPNNTLLTKEYVVCTIKINHGESGSTFADLTVTFDNVSLQNLQLLVILHV